MTPERYARICYMLSNRQIDLTICLEKVHKPHNISAMIRTADAVGIHQIHAVWPEKRLKARKAASAGSHNWIDVQTYPDSTCATNHIKKLGMQILVAHLHHNALNFRDVDYTRPTCILFGQEKLGISPETLLTADQYIMIPMLGMVQSLNVSVACALILYEAQRQRQQAGMYQRKSSQLTHTTQQRLLFEGGYPVLAHVARQKALPYPEIDSSGQIVASDEWWLAMQTTRG